MALILEVLDPRGGRTWHRLDALPLTLGRGFANDVILDDPYVDARHARLAVDETGSLQLEDQGSVNGLRAGAARVDGRLAIAPGVEVRIGRTTLRFHDADEALPPALVDDLPAAASPVVAPPPFGAPETAPAGALGRGARVRQWLATTPGRLAIAALAVAAFAFYTWLESTERSSGSAVFAAALTFAAATAMWAGLWSVASRVVVHRFEFVGHLAVIAAVALAVAASGVVEEWLRFLFPDSVVPTALSAIAGFALVAALFAAHLALASTMSRERRWRVGVAISAVIFMLVGVGELTDDDAFTDVPEFAGMVKPMPVRWMPTSSIDEFDAVMQELKEDVDEMAKEADPTLDARPDTTAIALPLEKADADSGR